MRAATSAPILSLMKTVALITARTFEVLLSEMPRVTAALEALAKRCMRRGLTPVTHAWGKAYARREHTSDTPCGEYPGCPGCDKVVRIPLTITGETPRYAGWTFAAALTHVEGETVIRAASEIPSRYRTTGGVCEHCKLVRSRGETYVVRHEDGRTMQVGSTCLADFLGDDAADKLAANASVLFQACGFAEDGEEGGQGGGRGALMLDEYLPMVAWCVRELGWISRTASRKNGGEATADKAWTFMFDGRACAEAKADPTEADVALAAGTVAWAESITDEQIAAETGDYLHSLRVVARAGYVTPKLMGVGASMIVAYERHLGRERAKADRAARPVSEYIGVVGERGLFDATLDFVSGYESDFGYVSVLKFVVASGAVLVWKTTTSGLERSDVGKRYIVRGTVKAHAEYKDAKQTTLSRAELSEFDQAIFDAETAEFRRKTLAAAVKGGTATDAERVELARLNAARKVANKATKAKIAACMIIETVPFVSHYPITHTALKLVAREDVWVDWVERAIDIGVFVRTPSGTREFYGPKGLDNAREFIAMLLAGVVAA